MTTGGRINGSTLDIDQPAWTGQDLQFPTSVCFAGEDLRTAYVGSLAMSRLPSFRSRSLGELPCDRTSSSTPRV